MRRALTALLLTALLLTALLLPCIPSPTRAGEPPDDPAQAVECAVVLHGLGRTHRSMNTMEESLKKEGYLTWNLGYPSTDHDILTLSDTYVAQAVEFCREHDASKIHFVTHSLGGILVRRYLADHELDEPGRIVMLSPPNQGSEIADWLKERALYQWGTGPAGAELGTGEDSVPLALPVPERETGIITGNWSSNPWFSDIIPGPDDGKVSVERAKLEGMDGFLVVERGHTFIMSAPEVIEQTIHFLKYGRFMEMEEEETEGDKITPPDP